MNTLDRIFWNQYANVYRGSPNQTAEGAHFGSLVRMGVGVFFIISGVLAPLVRLTTLALVALDEQGVTAAWHGIENKAGITLSAAATALLLKGRYWKYRQTPELIETNANALWGLDGLSVFIAFAVVSATFLVLMVKFRDGFLPSPV